MNRLPSRSRRLHAPENSSKSCSQGVTFASRKCRISGPRVFISLKATAVCSQPKRFRDQRDTYSGGVVVPLSGRQLDDNELRYFDRVRVPHSVALCCRQGATTVPKSLRFFGNCRTPSCRVHFRAILSLIALTLLLCIQMRSH